MKTKLGCWFNDVFIPCDDCKYGNDTDECAKFRKDFWAKYGYTING